MWRVILGAVVLGSATWAWGFPNLQVEHAPTENLGAITVDELGPVFSRTLPEEKSVSVAAKERKDERANNLLSMFPEEKPKEEKNPLEEEARNEMKALEDPEGVGEEPPKELRMPKGVVQAENARKEIELGGVEERKG